MKVPQSFILRKFKMVNERKMTTEEYSRLLEMANVGWMSVEEMAELSSDDPYAVILTSLNSERSCQNEYQNKRVTPIYDRVPKVLRENFRKAGIREGEFYRVMDAMTSFGVSRQDPNPYKIYVSTGQLSALPWVEDVSNIKNEDTPETKPFLFFLDKNSPDTTLLLQVPTDVFPVKYVPMLAYAYFFDKE